MWKPSVNRIRLASLLALTLFGLIGSGLWIAHAATSPVSPAGTYLDIHSIDSLLQSTTTPTSSSQTGPFIFETTFEKLNIRETTLVSPIASTVNYVKFPDNWLIGEGSYLEFDISHFYSQIDTGEDRPVFAGELRFLVNSELLSSFPLSDSNIEHALIRVDLPSNLINEDWDKVYNIEVVLDAEFLCDLVHTQSRVVIYPTSVLHLVYEEMPLEIDLGKYPKPFFQRAFEPDQVRFVLPEEPTAMEIQSSLGMAAELADLTRNQMVISATTPASWLEQTGASNQATEHLFVLGQPERNELIPLLNRTMNLPVELRERELSISTQGPEAVAPGDMITYNIAVTNTIPEVAPNLFVIDTMPAGTELVDCLPSCVEQPKGNVRWPLETLGPGETSQLTLTLRLHENVIASSLENNVVLADETKGPVNVNTLTTEVGFSQTSPGQVTSHSQGTYFFVQDNLVIPEGDGIIQEIISPWDPTRAILLVTGLSEEAVYKASQAMSTDGHFPGMQGHVALVREIVPLPPITETVATDITFADLGYSNEVAFGPYVQEINYRFFVPLGWRLTDEAYLNLYFSHSQVIDYETSSLNVFFNGTPIAGVTLNEENAINGLLQVSLPDSLLERGSLNALSIQATMLTKEEFEPCTWEEIERIWLTIRGDSFLHLDRFEQAEQLLDLEQFPFPYNQDKNLANHLFAFPAKVGLSELGVALRLAATLGSAAEGRAFRPKVMVGNQLEPEVLNQGHIIALGRPSVNPLLQEVNAQLPQPFAPGMDVVEQQVGEVIFRLPPGISLGYVQQILSPWNEDFAFLAVTGTTDEGVEWAGQMLTTRLSKFLKGNLALTLDGETVDAFDTRDLTKSASATIIAAAQTTPTVVTATPTPKLEPTLTPVPTLTPAPTAPPEGTQDVTNRIAELPTWVFGLVIGTILAVGFIIGLAVWQTRRRKE